MAYQPLNIDPATPPTVRRLIERLETLSFRDVHTMLRLPVLNYRLDAGCNFALSHVLLTAVGGISTTLYRKGNNDGERFKGLLTDHYPWNLEPAQNVTASEGARVIYEVFRNPLTHDLGLDLHNKSKGSKVKIKRMQRQNKNGGLTEKWIENLESSPIRPNISSAVTVRTGVYVLLVEALYWGLRRTVESMTYNPQLMKNAETFLAGKL